MDQTQKPRTANNQYDGALVIVYEVNWRLLPALLGAVRQLVVVVVPRIQERNFLYDSNSQVALGIWACSVAAGEFGLSYPSMGIKEGSCKNDHDCNLKWGPRQQPSQSGRFATIVEPGSGVVHRTEMVAFAFPLNPGGRDPRFPWSLHGHKEDEVITSFKKLGRRSYTASMS